MPLNRTNAKIYVECEAVSLTRDVPASGWLVEPIVRKLPSESLFHT